MYTFIYRVYIYYTSESLRFERFISKFGWTYQKTERRERHSWEITHLFESENREK